MFRKPFLVTIVLLWCGESREFVPGDLACGHRRIFGRRFPPPDISGGEKRRPQATGELVLYSKLVAVLR